MLTCSSKVVSLLLRITFARSFRMSVLFLLPVLISPYFFFCRLLQSANSEAQNLLKLELRKDAS